MAPSDVLFKGLMGMNVFIVGIAIKEFVLDIKKVRTNELEPCLKKNDIVIISKIFEPKDMKNKFIFIKNPYDNKNRFSYVIGSEGDWIKHRMHNTLIRVPTGHIWNEPGVLDNENERLKNPEINSSTNFIDSQSMIQGQVKYIIYPWNRSGKPLEEKPKGVEGEVLFAENQKISL